MSRYSRWLVDAFLVLTLCHPSAHSAPTLTTVQDILYKADGTRFNGVAFIEWRSFQASDFSNIAPNSVTVPIVDGNLRVQLVPTTNAITGASYTVRYNSDGRVQFVETWAVPPSSVPLKLKDVRVSGSSSSIPAGAPVTTQVQISDVIGLQTELNARPIKGAGFAADRVLIANSNGQIDVVVGNLSDCVRVDGTAGACGAATGGGPGFVDGETPAGLMNGSNTTFTLGQIPSPSSSLQLYRNGMLQKQGMDYSISGNTITFASGCLPQTGDLLLASYRLADSGNPAGAAGGHLTGTYPNPEIALGVISNVNIAAAAGIIESKLALNYPTHANINDPTGSEKAALAGTSGTPSTTNRFVTDQDSRLTNSRTPSGHSLLGSAHSDSTVGVVARGDLIVGQGTAATWSRLSLGPANRCLMSNGFDAVWNTCLYTGFTAGSIPFVDSIGNLSQNSTRLFWDNTNRRLGVGNNLSLATLYLYDATPATGSTTLVVRAGQAQSTSPLQQWMDASGIDVARIAHDGAVTGAAFYAASTPTRASWHDSGTAGDPSVRADGDAWYNSTALSRKSHEGGQVHTSPQVLCSSTGSSTSSTTLTRVGSCTIPAGLLKAGDRVDVQFSYSHEGAATPFIFEIRWGGSGIVSRSIAAGETRVAGRASVGVYSTGAQWDVQSWGSSLSLAASAGNAADSLAAPLIIDLLGQMEAATSETITLRNFTVIRYPAQSNP